jgi:hypothetical protein
MSTFTFGETVEGLTVDGREIRTAVFNEHGVRAAAGLTMVIGAVAFAYAYFDKNYVPLQVVTAFFFLEFLIRVTIGLKYSPMGVIGLWMVKRKPPEWASAKPKRFAWSMALVLSAAMTVITNSGIRGYLPRTICLVCLTLMWLEAVLGICLGCEIHGLLVQRGWIAKHNAYEICAHGACEIPGARAGTTWVGAPAAPEAAPAEA